MEKQGFQFPIEILLVFGIFTSAGHLENPPFLLCPFFDLVEYLLAEEVRELLATPLGLSQIGRCETPKLWWRTWFSASRGSGRSHRFHA
jgi:hypothetical protein